MESTDWVLIPSWYLYTTDQSNQVLTTGMGSWMGGGGGYRVQKSISNYLHICANKRRLNEKTGNCMLILYKTNGQRAVLNAYTHPFYCPPETLIWHQFCGRSQCCLFCFFVNSQTQSHPYKSMNKPNLSWSRARRVISYRCTLIGEVMRALHCPIVR